MFSIGFIDERFKEAEPGEKGRVGLLVLGQHEERFIAHTLNWSESEYVHHWTVALKRALETGRSALITDLLTPSQSSHLVWWPVWKINDELVFHNQLLFFEEYNLKGSGFDVEGLYSLVSEHASYNTEGDLISEWRVPLGEVQRFLRDRIV
jgi:CdiI N-terminal domain